MALGMAKKGQSTGEDFDSDIVLCKMEISKKAGLTAEGNGGKPSIGTIRWFGQTMALE